jgi:hypothetical protein
MLVVRIYEKLCKAQFKKRKRRAVHLLASQPHDQGQPKITLRQSKHAREVFSPESIKIYYPVDRTDARASRTVIVIRA